MRQIIIDSSSENQRLDKFLLKYLNDSPKSFVYKMLRKKNITLNGKKAGGSEILKTDDYISLFLADRTIEKFSTTPDIRPAGEVIICYEDENILICHKQAGVLSHARQKGDEDTLIDRILYYLYKKGEFDPENKNTSFTPGLCNRLDRNTEGLVICGKNLSSSQWLNEAVKNRKIDKFYLTAVYGDLFDPFVMETGFEKNEKTNTVKIVEKSEETAGEMVTEVYPLKQKNGFTLLKIKLITGKTHQIRAQLKAKGYPVLCDAKYGDIKANKRAYEIFSSKYQLLCASELVFKEKSGCLHYMADKPVLSRKPDWINYFNTISF